MQKFTVTSGRVSDIVDATGGVYGHPFTLMDAPELPDGRYRCGCNVSDVGDGHEWIEPIGSGEQVAGTYQDGRYEHLAILIAEDTPCQSAN